MSQHETDLLEIAERQAQLAASLEAPAITTPLKKLEDGAATFAKAWSGSWLGYHSRVYYDGIQPPPPGARFSREWGLMQSYAGDTRGDWREYDGDEIKNAIRKAAGNPDFGAIEATANDVKRKFEQDKSSALSILSVAKPDAFLEKAKKGIEKLSILNQTEVVHAIAPSGQIMSRDMAALTAGLQTPPHIEIAASIVWVRMHSEHCKQLAELSRGAAEHLARLSARTKANSPAGTHIFIGHGRSLLWRELKDFLEDKLHLPVDEFNRVPVAGVTNIARLGQMLEAAAIAFIIMTGEDETPDGTLRARMNVVHEAGLFQGKLGFTRAIVLLEEGCDEFSNIAGLGHIRFPKGNIKAAFQEIREVLEREEILAA